MRQPDCGAFIAAIRARKGGALFGGRWSAISARHWRNHRQPPAPRATIISNPNCDKEPLFATQFPGIHRIVEKWAKIYGSLAAIRAQRGPHYLADDGCEILRKSIRNRAHSQQNVGRPSLRTLIAAMDPLYLALFHTVAGSGKNVPKFSQP